MSCFPGQRLDDDEFEAILQEADLNGDLHIDYEEFLQVHPYTVYPFVVCARPHTFCTDAEALKCNSGKERGRALSACTIHR